MRRRSAPDLAGVDVVGLAVAQLTLPFQLAHFFRERASVEEARDRVAHALDTREQRFLSLLETDVFARRGSVYRWLFEQAGCSYADVRAAVRTHGLERALVDLAGAGVWLGSDEFKGKADVVRNGRRFRVTPASVAPLRRSAGLLAPSSGTSNRPLRSLKQLGWIAEETWPAALFLEGHGLVAHAHAGVEPIIPGVAGVVFLMFLARLGIPVARWFGWRVPVPSRLERAYDGLLARELAWAATRFGPGFDSPRDPGDDLEAVVRWAERCGRERRPCCIRAVASNTTRVARTALRLGVSLNTTTFIASGEPLTSAKVDVMRSTGARVALLYGFEPGVHAAFGCPDAAHIDDMHVNLNTLAVVEHPRAIDHAGRTVRPLLYTTLYPTASKLLLNFDSGDHAVLERRACGCASGRAGLDLHVHHVGSHEKLTAEGLAYEFSELAEILEAQFPARFGGGPGDYQLVEHEAADGRTFVTLLVDPGVGECDERAVLGFLRGVLADGSRGRSFMAKVWEQADALRVERRRPIASARGKVLPLRRASELRGTNRG